MTTEYGTVNQSQTFGHYVQKLRNGVLNVFGKEQKRHPAQPIAKQSVPDARRIFPKDFPVLILP